MSKGGDAVTVGYKYYVGMHMIICHGPVDAITRFRFGDRVAWGPLSEDYAEITTDSTLTLNKPMLFGGDYKEGGVAGHIDVCMGAPTQPRNNYLRKHTVNKGKPLPAYRGLLGLVFRGLYGGGFYWAAMNPYIKPVAPTVRRILKGWNNDACWYPAKAQIGVDMNPIHIIVQCMTDPEWGMGYPTTVLGSSFVTAADKCYTEGFGLSLMWTQQTSINEFVKMILSHIDGTIYLDKTTGKFELTLFRADYDVNTLPVLGPSNVVSVDEFQRSAWGETVNQITVEWTDPRTEDTSAITVQDLANIRVQGGVVANTVRYQGIRSAELAYRVADRDLRKVCVPLAAVKLTALRMFDFKHGGLFRLTWPEHDLVDVVFRILSVDYGTLDSPTMRIDAVEDVFAMPTNSYGSPEDGLWVPGDTPPADLTTMKYVEATYYEVKRWFGPGDFSTLTGTEAYPVILASRPAEQNQVFRVYHSALPQSNPSHVYEQILRHGLHTPSLDANGAVTELQTTFSFDTDLDLIYEGDVDVYAHWDNEIVHITNINTTTKIATIRRGILDTIPQAHADNSRVWLFNGTNGGFGMALDVERGESGYMKLTGVSLGGETKVADAIETGLTYSARWSRPWPAAKVQIDGQYFPAVATNRRFVTTWVGRNRVTQDTGFTPWTDGHIAPEAGTTYTLKIYNNDNNTLLSDNTGLTVSGTGGTFTAPALAATRVRVELSAIRSGVASEFAFVHAFTLPGYDAALLHFDGTPPSAAFVDDSGKAWATAGGAQHSATQVKFGTASMYCGGSVFDFITSNVHDDFDLTTDFTVECWARFEDFASRRGVWKLGALVATANFMSVVAWTDGSVHFVGVGASGYTWAARSSAGAVSTTVWHHIAAVRRADDIWLYVDGALVASATATGTPATAKQLIVGMGTDGFQSYMKGYIDEMRVRRGTAIYTAPFTPPAGPFTYLAP